jgi:hypothetical protein
MTPELFRILDKIFGMDALAFIDKPPDAKKLAPVYVLHGDEDFLKRQVLSVLRKVVSARRKTNSDFLPSRAIKPSLRPSVASWRRCLSSVRAGWW